MRGGELSVTFSPRELHSARPRAPEALVGLGILKLERPRLVDHEHRDAACTAASTPSRCRPGCRGGSQARVELSEGAKSDKHGVVVPYGETSRTRMLPLRACAIPGSAFLLGVATDGRSIFSPGPSTRSGMITVRPEAVAGVRYFGRYRTGWIRDGVLLSVS